MISDYEKGYIRGYENALMRIIRIAENIKNPELLKNVLDLIYEVYKIEKGDQHINMPTASTAETHANESYTYNYNKKSCLVQEGGEIVQRKQSY